MNRKKIRADLDRLGSHITGLSAKAASDSLVPKHYKSLAKELGGDLIEHCGGTVCRVDESFPYGYLHGRFELKHARQEFEIPLAAFQAKAIDDSKRFDELLFFDTETTGLGGSGAVAFLVGVGSVTTDGFEVRQYLIPDYSDEAAMMELLLEEFQAHKTLVSFNGASFDLPLLESRMIINRAARSIKSAYHIDLLHAARRIFKRRLRDCTLVNLERELFGFDRVDDIPGYLIPAVYFDWVQDRRSDDLKSVLLHNRLDILSLYYLLIILSEAYKTKGESLRSISDLYSLSRIFCRQKDIDSADRISSRIETETGSAEADIRLHNSMIFKRGGRFEEAIAIWEDLSGLDLPQAFPALIELAKYHEHKSGNLARALEYSLQAERRLDLRQSQIEVIGLRIARLRRKIGR